MSHKIEELKKLIPSAIYMAKDSNGSLEPSLFTESSEKDGYIVLSQPVTHETKTCKPEDVISLEVLYHKYIDKDEDGSAKDIHVFSVKAPSYLASKLHFPFGEVEYVSVPFMSFETSEVEFLSEKWHEVMKNTILSSISNIDIKRLVSYPEDKELDGMAIASPFILKTKNSDKAINIDAFNGYIFYQSLEHVPFTVD